MNLERRITELERRAGVNKEGAIILIRNNIRDNTACKGYRDTELCPAFNSFERNPKGMNKSGFIVFRFPCKDCKEAI
ncbi:MAG: hypothetical protein A3K22_04135 [Deltaproteobacteria bacterium RBG_16_42_7]|nr:MAG: hypothetical protein A2052_02070 [Deltaproteobacteria bacterium GWA2_54_12]OGP65727.1 MAG: hypothetical protein A3K22_04135 [Deltaproteobacteria bacterium RBG_16_42_7]